MSNDQRTHEERAIDAYMGWCNNQPIHCNRLPSWRELSKSEQNEWLRKVSSSWEPATRAAAALAATPQQPAQPEPNFSIGRDPDGDVSIDFAVGSDMLSVSVSAAGVAAYAYHWGGHKAHGKEQAPPVEQPAQAELLQALIAATDLLHVTVKSSDRPSDYVMRAVAGFRALIAKAAAIQAPEAGPAQAPVKPPKHRFWGAGEPDCPANIKAPNGELHSRRCKVCGETNPPDQFCWAAVKATAAAHEPAASDRDARDAARFRFAFNLSPAWTYAVCKWDGSDWLPIDSITGPDELSAAMSAAAKEAK
jgi:hypothetical protein